MPKIPKASYQTSILSGIILGILGALCSFIEIDQEGGPGTLGITIGLLTSVYAILSCIFFVSGFEKLWELDPSKASYWKANFPRLKRGLVYFISAVITMRITITIINSL